MTTEQFDRIITELRGIREALTNANAKPPTAPATAAPARDAFAARPEIPQPTALVDDPDAVVVHFGKNAGTPLGALGERSIEWYASVKEPKLDRNGKPFPPRAVDVALENAARQIIHRRRNTSAIPTSVPVPNNFDSVDSEAF
jgi:hypothetical protein